ncbi:nucleotide-binding universal stress UspA family protein [Actinomycetospora succinea]|uniref:Nucleotide-binding universal stress UspA family protein n=1 Tax=Actinomycetospora succinea TaxID=663603 RepID=A0A4R6V0L4_9PSEU|nr:universal stress protein [Actinomycetospora succinea]TDQ51873.1 nucleotide-binding universal stress UspA family protein [Actinomycetospora succinea]
MGAYQTVAVGTDGSESSFRAVDRAATIAADSKALLLIICAYKPAKSTGEAEQALGEDAAFHVIGSTPAEETLRDARERAAAKGSVEIDTVAVQGDPIERVVEVVTDRKADLVVVGNRGLNSLAGRLLGSVPQGISRRAGSDVLIVHTT